MPSFLLAADEIHAFKERIVSGERYSNMAHLYCKDANLAVVVYDLTSPRSAECSDITGWAPSIEEAEMVSDTPHRQNSIKLAVSVMVYT